ncbi:hypothetical protein K1719_000912 [Acacia pycnantha]|nr:hypothetical protein K1719_000912 [Acacia pycnantha]
MLEKRMVSIKKLAKKMKGVGVGGDHDPDPAHHQFLLREYAQESSTTIPTAKKMQYYTVSEQKSMVLEGAANELCSASSSIEEIEAVTLAMLPGYY